MFIANVFFFLYFLVGFTFLVQIKYVDIYIFASQYFHSNGIGLWDRLEVSYLSLLADISLKVSNNILWDMLEVLSLNVDRYSPKTAWHHTMGQVGGTISQCGQI